MKSRVLKTTSQEVLLKTADLEAVKCDTLYNEFDKTISLFSRAKNVTFRRVAKDTIFEQLKPEIELSIKQICKDINIDAVESALPNFNAVLRHIFYVAVAKKIKAAGL